MQGMQIKNIFSGIRENEAKPKRGKGITPLKQKQPADQKFIYKIEGENQINLIECICAFRLIR